MLSGNNGVSEETMEFTVTACRVLRSPNLVLTHLRTICGQHRCEPFGQEARLCRKRTGHVTGYLSMLYSEKMPNLTRKDSKEGLDEVSGEGEGSEHGWTLTELDDLLSSAKSQILKLQILPEWHCQL